jgi:siderophore synthetase component
LRCILLKEVLGISCVLPAVSPLTIQKTYGTLGCIWRESLHTYLDEDEDAVPFQSLIHLESSGRPFIDPWVQHEGLQSWLSSLFQVCIPPLLHLLYAHGVALEAHAQNMILVHRQGQPVRMAFKDFHDGIRFSRELLQEPELCPPLVPTPDIHARVNRNSFVETADPLLVRDFLLDAFFFINLGQLALFLQQHYGFDEEVFWSLAVDVITRYRERFPELQSAFETFDLFAPTISVEQLTTRRLLPDTELRLHEVRNALARFRLTTRPRERKVKEAR